MFFFTNKREKANYQTEVSSLLPPASLCAADLTSHEGCCGLSRALWTTWCWRSAEKETRFRVPTSHLTGLTLVAEVVLWLQTLSHWRSSLHLVLWGTLAVAPQRTSWEETRKPQAETQPHVGSNQKTRPWPLLSTTAIPTFKWVRNPKIIPRIWYELSLLNSTQTAQLWKRRKRLHLITMFWMFSYVSLCDINLDISSPSLGICWWLFNIIIEISTYHKPPRPGKSRSSS